MDNQPYSRNPSYVLAVHAGAGAHPQENDRANRRIIRACLRHVSLTCSKDSPAVELVTTAVAFLEDDPLTNAGTGCTLNRDGIAECDACVVTAGMSGTVGALHGVRNPVQVAEKLRQSLSVPNPGGLHPPSILVADGARAFASRIGVSTNYDASTHRTRRLWQEYLHQVSHQTLNDNTITDTVGAVALDVNGNLAAAASSGGGWLRPQGRLGAAAVPGAGCFVANYGVDDNEGCAAVASGHGERIIGNALATRAALDPDGDGWRRIVGSSEVGILVLQKQVGGASILVNHSTAAFAVGWHVPAQCKTHAVVSRCVGKTEDGWVVRWRR